MLLDVALIHPRHQTHTDIGGIDGLLRVEAGAGALAVVLRHLVLDELVELLALQPLVRGDGVGALTRVRLADSLPVLLVVVCGVCMLMRQCKEGVVERFSNARYARTFSRCSSRMASAPSQPMPRSQLTVWRVSGMPIAQWLFGLAFNSMDVWGRLDGSNAYR